MSLLSMYWGTIPYLIIVSQRIWGLLPSISHARTIDHHVDMMSEIGVLRWPEYSLWSYRIEIDCEVESSFWCVQFSLCRFHWYLTGISLVLEFLWSTKPIDTTICEIRIYWDTGILGSLSHQHYHVYDMLKLMILLLTQLRSIERALSGDLSLASTSTFVTYRSCWY